MNTQERIQERAEILWTVYLFMRTNDQNLGPSRSSHRRKFAENSVSGGLLRII